MVGQDAAKCSDEDSIAARDGGFSFLGLLARQRAHGLAGVAGLHWDDRHDLEQEIKLRALRRIGQYNPQRGTVEAYLTTLVDSAAKSIVRFHCAKKRNGSRTVPLSSLPASMVESLLAHGDKGSACLSLRDCVERLVNRLSEPDRALCERLKQRTVTEIARDDGVPRTTLQARVERIRRRFEEEGLREFL